MHLSPVGNLLEKGAYVRNSFFLVYYVVDHDRGQVL
jgi:hypothetical protein